MAYSSDLLLTLKELPKQAWSALRSPFETSAPEGRSKERYRRAALTVLASVAAKGISLLSMIISVPLTLNYLGAERYGVWMTISSLILMLGFADLGMGNGLMNAISEAHGNDDRQAAVHYVSSGVFMLSGIMAFVLMGFFLIYHLVPWAGLFNVKSPLAAQEAGPALAVFVICFSVSLPLGVVQRVQMGYQEGYWFHLFQGFGSILGLMGLLLVIYFQAGLAWLVLATAGPPALALFLNGMVLFVHDRPWLRPRWRSVTFAAAKKISHLGLLFFVLQLAIVITFSSDNIVAALILGPEAVTQYAVPMRMFSVFPMIMFLLIVPLWPAYGEALARGDMAWVRRTVVRSLIMTFLVVGLPSFFLVLFSKPILHLWVGSAITPSFSLLLGLGIWSLLGALGNSVSMFLNAANVLRLQVICALLLSITSLVTKVLLIKAIGLPGIIWGTIIAYSLFTAVPIGYYMLNLLNVSDPCQMVNILQRKAAEGPSHKITAFDETKQGF